MLKTIWYQKISYNYKAPEQSKVTEEVASYSDISDKLTTSKRSLSSICYRTRTFITVFTKVLQYLLIISHRRTLPNVLFKSKIHPITCHEGTEGE